MRAQLAGIAVLFLTPRLVPVAPQESRPAGVQVYYSSSSDLTVIKITDRKLECTYHAPRKDKDRVMRQSGDEYDEHSSRIYLTDGELEELGAWSQKAIQTGPAPKGGDYGPGYHTPVLEVRIDGTRYRPGPEMVEPLWAFVKRVVADRTKAALQ